MTGKLVESLDVATAAANGDIVWTFALRVLTFRQEPPAGLTSFRAVEEAALQLVINLTLKLTESRFKPMFLRLVDWAATPPSSGHHPFSSASHRRICYARKWISGWKTSLG
jgi:U3 small nucleolar RNA-associated protein 10